MTDVSSGTARYNRHARLELRLKTIFHPFRPPLSFHRHVKSPLESKPPADRLYELVEHEAGGFLSKVVLDAGCGFGGLLVWAAVHRNAQVTGITMSEGQIKWSRPHLKKYGILPSSMRLGNYDDLPANSFDVIIAIESLIHSPNLSVSLRSMHNALRAGGSLIVVDDFWSHSDPEFVSLLSDLGWGIACSLTLQSATDAAERAGFSLANNVDLTASLRLEPAWVGNAVGRILSHVPLRKGSFIESRTNFYRALLVQNSRIHSGRTHYRLVRFAKSIQ